MANTAFKSEVKWTGSGLQSDAQAGAHVESSCPVKDSLSGHKQMKRPRLHHFVLGGIMAALAVGSCFGETNTAKGERASMQIPSNHLAGQKSPYLLQHVHNPVDWYPWGEEAFEKARRENKPIFLSIGYSTCHWCHVMARESFENAEIAALLNQNFVAIKVDREERPDIDKVYMTYVQAATGGGGWPMSIWLTPDLKPFMGGTYYPPEDRYGRPGLKHILLHVSNAWKTDRARIVEASDGVLKQLQQMTTSSSTETVLLERDLLDQAYRHIKSSFDSRYGGFGGAPKFPRPSVPDLMLRYYARTGTQDALDMTLLTLRKMADGGIHDQLGGGFHRYSVDERWHVPHFEKMLYDQAQLACTYLDAYQITHDPFYTTIARDILDYVQRDMTAPQGAFYSAEDADSAKPEHPKEHAEGAFYAWEQHEIENILGKKAAALFNFYYGVEPDGNVRNDPQGEFHNKNILFVAHSTEETAKRFGKQPEDIRAILADARQQLFAARNERPHPHLDDKTITAWNGLMISAFARAAQVLNDPSYLSTASNAALFIKQTLYNEESGVLLRRYRAGEAAIEGYADDYAFLIHGLLDLYEASFNVDCLTWAIALQNKQNELFWDAKNGGYFSTTGQDGTVLLRMKEDYDGAEPSANSISLLNLLRLAQMTDNSAYRKKADQTLTAFSRTLTRAPYTMPKMMAAFDSHLNTPKQIIIAGRRGAPDTEALLQVVHEHFIPNKIMMLADGSTGQQALAHHFEFITSIGMIDGKATAYVCENNVCNLPINDAETLRRKLDETDRQSARK